MMVSPRGEVGGEWESYSEAEGESSSVTQVYMNVYMTSGKSHAFPWKPTIRNGEGGIRTHGDQESSIDGLRSGFLLQGTIAVLTAKMRFGVDSLVCWKGVS